MYCTRCGKWLDPPEAFCTVCGKPRFVPRPLTDQPLAGLRAEPRPIAGSRSPAARQRRRITRLTVLVILLAAAGFGTWQLGQSAGWWRQIRLRQAAAAWDSQPDTREVRQSIHASLTIVADALAANDLDSALQGFHPDRRKTYAQLFAAQPKRIQDLATALRSPELTYLSTDSGNYEAGRMAIVTLPLPAKSASQNGTDPASFTLTLTWYEDRWVIDS